MAQVALLMEQVAVEQKWKFGLNTFQYYICEVFGHIGVQVRLIDSIDELSKSPPDVLLVGAASESVPAMSAIWSFAERGGTVISYGGLNSMAKQLGCRMGSLTGPGYATLSPMLAYDAPIRFLEAVPWVRTPEAQVVCNEVGLMYVSRPDGECIGSLLLQFKVGDGTIERFAVDVPTTIVGLQQGTHPVFEDGAPAPDGTAAINDGVLKADDGSSVDWETDRAELPSRDKFFPHPYGDLWREAIIGHVLRRIVDQGMTLPFVGYWPEGVSHVAFVSLDSDYNRDAEAETALTILRECGIPSTWSMIEPGYSSYIYDLARADGHEIAFHYNAVEVDNGVWGDDEFARQLNWLRTAAGQERIVSQKNHLTRWEGWGDLFAWCEKNRIATDQTRGVSKKGNAGFLFGTCHPYFPIAWSNEHNRFYDVLEIGFLLGDFTFVDSDVIQPFLQAVQRVEGVAHFVFHQTHLHTKDHVRDWLRKLVTAARDRGFVFWTGEQINHWERSRRRLAIICLDAAGNVQVAAGTELENAVIWIPVAEEVVTENEGISRKFGVLCHKGHVLS